MSVEFHHLDKWGYANLDLCEETLENNPKAVVLISGASSSGKTFLANYLKNLLEQNGHHALVLTLDQYDYGLSGIIPNKVNLNDFNQSLKNIDEIEERIKNIIIDLPFDDKFSEPVLVKIRSALTDLLATDELDRFINGLRREWKVLNFDEPSVYNLQEAAKDIIALTKNKKVREKLYSKITSERVPSAIDYDGSHYDVVIVEGIYALDPNFLSHLRSIVLIKDFIDGNPKSLFLRRIIRDEKETGSPSAFTTKIYFKYIVKAYVNTILPCRKCADVILNNDMSFSELRNGDLYTTRDNFPITSETAALFLKANSTITAVIYEKDFYFVAPSENQESNNILRFREISSDKGETYHPYSLVHKGVPKTRKDNKIVRPINVLLDDKEILEVWENEENCLADFLNSGFEINRVEKKIKTKLTYKGQKLVLYEVSGRNCYIELVGDYIPKVYEEIKKIIR